MQEVKLALKNNIPPRVFSTLFKLYKWYQIAQRTTYMMTVGEAKYCVNFKSVKITLISHFDV